MGLESFDIDIEEIAKDALKVDFKELFPILRDLFIIASIMVGFGILIIPIAIINEIKKVIRWF